MSPDRRHKETKVAPDTAHRSKTPAPAMDLNVMHQMQKVNEMVVESADLNPVQKMMMQQ